MVHVILKLQICLASFTIVQIFKYQSQESLLCSFAQKKEHHTCSLNVPLSHQHLVVVATAKCPTTSLISTQITDAIAPIIALSCSSMPPLQKHACPQALWPMSVTRRDVLAEITFFCPLSGRFLRDVTLTNLNVTIYQRPHAFPSYRYKRNRRPEGQASRVVCHLIDSPLVKRRTDEAKADCAVTYDGIVSFPSIFLLTIISKGQQILPETNSMQFAAGRACLRSTSLRI